MPWTLKRIMSVGIWVLFILCIIGYAIYQSRAVREGPVITVSTPQNGATVTEPLIRVSGVATQAKELYLDGRGIFIDLKGHFNEELLLLPGYNIIELTAKDAGGRETRTTIELAYIGNASSTPRAPLATTTTSAVRATTSVTH
jgi:hypothetical protein